MTSELTSSDYFELIGELIPELTSSQCNWKGNRKGKGTDETNLYTANVLYVVLTDVCLPSKFTNNTK